jgi:hypothetical protein
MVRLTLCDDKASRWTYGMSQLVRLGVEESGRGLTANLCMNKAMYLNDDRSAFVGGNR